MRGRAYGVALTCVLIVVASATLTPANANVTGGVDSSSNIWAPYGPYASQLQLKFYSSATAEIIDFINGHLDLTDVSASACIYYLCIFSQDFTTSPREPQLKYFGIQFNQHNLTGPGITNTWASWGCNFQHATSSCGVEIREAFAHLIDRASFAASNLGSRGQGIADPVSPAQDPSGSSLTTQNSWDTLSGKTIGGLTHPATISAFHIAPSPGGFAAPGSPDFCAARDHLIAANIGLKDDNHDCIIDPDSPDLPNIINHPIRFIIRTTDRTRLALGLGLINAINQLFGVQAAMTPFCPVTGIICIIPVFTDPPLGPIDDWDMYTYGYQVGPLADHLDDLYDGLQATDQCGGPQNGLPANNGFICIPGFDQNARAATSTNDLSTFGADTLAALNEFGKHAADIPVYTPAKNSIALTDMAGLVDQRGVGFSNFWSVLNGRNNLTYTPVNSIYTFGGGTSTLRWGQSIGTFSLNPFTALTDEDLTVLGEVYDTLFTASPVQRQNVLCWMCNNFVESFDASGNTHFLAELRQSLRWQDGVPVDAKDIKFSLLNLRDFASSAGIGAFSVLDVRVLSVTTLDIAMKGRSLSHLANLAQVPIIPRHLWELSGDTTYGDVGRVDPAKTDFTFDPLTTGIFIGSGPFVCRSLFPEDAGRTGTGCAKDNNGARIGGFLDFGGTLTLQRYDMTGQPGNVDPFLQYMRSFNPAWATGSGTAAFSGQFQEFSWADRYDNATVTIRDLASVAACFGRSSPAGCADYSYWLRPAFHPAGPNTISSEVAIVASHLDDTWVFPFSWSGDQGKQPGQTLENIVPFTP